MVRRPDGGQRFTTLRGCKGTWGKYCYRRRDSRAIICPLWQPDDYGAVEVHGVGVMPQPRNPKAIRPRVKDARAFDAALRKAWLDPFISDMQRRLAQAQGVNQAYALL